MTRLTKREHGHACYIECPSTCDSCNGSCGMHQRVIDRLAHYEDLEEQGRLVVLPCKIDDTVYMFHRRIDGSDCVREAEFWWSDIPQFGKTVFLTRSEAESALTPTPASDVPEGE